MARYRFRWENLPRPLLKALKDFLELSNPTHEALRTRYGARPKPGFVKLVWPLLRDEWLRRDTQSRLGVVQSLLGERLGDQSISVRSKVGQMEYLQSCRNSKALQEIVHAYLLEAGERSADSPVPPRPPAASRTRNTPAESHQIGTEPEGPPDSSPDELARSADDSSLEAFIDKVLKSAFGQDKVVRDEDGDIPINVGSSLLFIRVIRDEHFPVHLHIFSILVHEIPATPELYEVLNNVSAGLKLAKIVHLPEDRIYLAADIPASTLSEEELLWAISFLGSASDHFDTMLAKRFGGTTTQRDDQDAIDV